MVVPRNTNGSPVELTWPPPEVPPELVPDEVPEDVVVVPVELPELLPGVPPPLVLDVPTTLPTLQSSADHPWSQIQHAPAHLPCPEHALGHESPTGLAKFNVNVPAAFPECSLIVSENPYDQTREIVEVVGTVRSYLS